MAVVKIEEIAGKSGQSQGPDNSSIVRIFRVWTNEPFDTPVTIAPAMPIQYGTPLGENSAFLCLGTSFEQEQKGPGLSVWIATYTFRTSQIDEEKVERQQVPNPLDRRTRVSMRIIRYGQLKIRDRFGDVKRNSAGEIYPPNEVDVPRVQCNFMKNVQEVPDWFWDLTNRINNAPVTIRGIQFSTGSLKFFPEELPEKKIENGVKHFPLRWILEARDDGWSDPRVDAGFYYLDGDSLKRILDADDNPTVVEEWLDGNGARLRDTIPNPQPGDETINEFFDYREADFSVMPIAEVASGTA